MSSQSSLAAFFKPKVTSGAASTAPSGKRPAADDIVAPLPKKAAVSTALPATTLSTDVAVEGDDPAPPISTSAADIESHPATAADAEAAYAAAFSLPCAQNQSNSVSGDSVKEVSFHFLKDRRDLQGRRPGEAGFDKTTIQVRLTAKEKLTPGQEQYWSIKKLHADCVICFKMGKFYELFEEDALLGHRELDLAFMGKGAPHAGFPEAALPKYAQKLVELGFKVGIVEQMETPDQLAARNAAKPKGVTREKTVRRELCSVITKGTAFHRDDQATYLLGVSEDVHTATLGVSFVDAATGHFHIGQCVDDEHHNSLRTLLAQLRPDEIIVDHAQVSNEVLQLLRRAVPEALFNRLPPAAFYASRAEAASALCREGYFRGDKEKAAAAASDDAEAGWPSALRTAAEESPAVGLRAFGGIASYLKRLLLDTQLLSMRHISSWTPTDRGVGLGNVVLDAKALENLEIFSNSSAHSSKGTLFAIVSKCSSAFGQRALRKWLCAPPRQVADIAARQEIVGAFIESDELHQSLSKTLRKLPDLERLIARVHAFSLQHAQNQATHYQDVGRARLGELIKTLEGFEALEKAARRVAADAAGVRYVAPYLARLLTAGEGFPDLADLLAAFRRAFDWGQAKAEGRVIPTRGVDTNYDRAHDSVAEHKDKIEGIKLEWQRRLGDKEIELWSAAGSPTEPFQLAVPEATLERKGTPAEFEQMSSKKGTRRFYTPDLKRAVSSYLSAKEKLDLALTDGARRLYGRFSAQFAQWYRAVKCAAELDCLLCLATVSATPGMCRPAFDKNASSPFLHISRGVNICVQAALAAGADCIPNDITIGPTPPDADPEATASYGAAVAEASPPTLLVTGPNMGGKSTLLRQTCVTALLAHLGCHVPAEACTLSPVDRIFTRVGANDAIMAGLSTFRVELEETASILEHATRHSIVILDELGRGTATFDGMAIAHAVLSHLANRIGCRSLFATHYHALTRDFEVGNSKVVPYHMACTVDAESRAVTFLYRFVKGASHRSHGVSVAKLAGLPEHVLDLAASKSAELEGLIDETHTLHLARRVLLAVAVPASPAEATGTDGLMDSNREAVRAPSLLTLWRML